MDRDKFFESFDGEDDEPLSPEEQAALQRIMDRARNALQPRMPAISRAIGKTAMPRSAALTAVLSNPGQRLSRQLTRDLLPAARLAAEMINKAAFSAASGRASTSPSDFGPAMPKLPRTALTRPAVIATYRPKVISDELLAAIRPAYRAFTEAPDPPDEVKPVIEVARLVDEGVIEEAVRDVLEDPELREAMEESARESLKGGGREVPHVGWYLALGIICPAPIPATVAVAIEPDIHPVIDTIIASTALSIAMIALFIYLCRKS